MPREVTQVGGVFGQVVTTRPLVADGDFVSFPLKAITHAEMEKKVTYLAH